MIDKYMLEGERLGIGCAVIVNTMDRPCGKLVAIVEAIEGDDVKLIYLCQDTGVVRCTSCKDIVTPISHFGVSCWYENDFNSYFCTTPSKLSHTKATYPNGDKRVWQENETYSYRPRKEALIISMEKCGVGH